LCGVEVKRVFYLHGNTGPVTIDVDAESAAHARDLVGRALSELVAGRPIQKVEIVVKGSDDPTRVARMALDSLLKTQMHKKPESVCNDSKDDLIESLRADNELLKASLDRAIDDATHARAVAVRDIAAARADLATTTDLLRKAQHDLDIVRATADKAHRRAQTLEGNAAKAAQTLASKHDGCNREIARMQKHRDDREKAYGVFLKAYRDENAALKADNTAHKASVKSYAEEMGRLHAQIKEIEAARDAAHDGYKGVFNRAERAERVAYDLRREIDAFRGSLKEVLEYADEKNYFDVEAHARAKALLG
jgi:chromosome segregation ATPase